MKCIKMNVINCHIASIYNLGIKSIARERENANMWVTINNRKKVGDRVKGYMNTTFQKKDE